MVLKSFGILLVLSLFCLSSMAQKLKTTHTRLIGGTGYEVAYDAIYDPRDKSIVFTGYTEDSCGTGDLPPCPAVYGSRDLLVGKIDSNRNLVWLRQYGGSNTEDGRILDTTEDGGYMVLGPTSSIDGDVTNSHGNDIWFLKLNSSGNIQWEKSYGSINGVEIPGSAKQTTDKGYIIIGNSSGSGEDVPFQYVSSPFTTDWFVVKTDSGGNKQWAKTIGGTGSEEFSRIFEINNSYYIAGLSTSHDHECDDVSWHGATPTGRDYFLIKLDIGGNYLWNKSYGGTGSDQISDALFDERDSTIVMVGHTTSTDYMVPQSPSPRQDVLVMKVDLEGNLKWSKVFGDNSNEWMAHIRKSPVKGGYIVSCRADPVSPVPAYYFGATDISLFLIDSSGKSITDKIVGGISGELNGYGVSTWNGFAVIGSSNSDPFADGTTSVKHGTNVEIFATFLDYWPVSTHSHSKYEESIKVYPSPAGDKLNIGISQELRDGRLRIIDSGGKIVWQKRVRNSHLETIDVSMWSRGVYIVTWHSETGKIFRQNILIQ